MLTVSDISYIVSGVISIGEKCHVCKAGAGIFSLLAAETAISKIHEMMVNRLVIHLVLQEQSETLCFRFASTQFLDLLLQLFNLMILIVDGLQQSIQLLVLNGCRILLFHALQEIRKDVHVVNERIVC